MGAGVDFVVFGFGLGAILMLVGFALRDLGPWLFGSTREESALPEFEGAKTTIRKQTLSSIGNAISVGGAGIAVVTFSALLAKTDDDLGSIVVGMSLVLATVGVAAWTYDVFRRYRAAMEIVSAQEHIARERLAPRSKRRKPRPAAPEPVTEQPVLAATSNEATGPTDHDLTPDTQEEPLTTTEEPLAVEDQLPGWHDGDAPAAAAPEPQADDDANDATAVAEVSTPAEDRNVGSEAPAQPDSKMAPAPSIPMEHQPRREPERVELPPLPTEADDALIDEAVRFEPRQQAQRTVPSWLFEDLETDLATHNPAKQDDPVDQFQEAKPYTRPSALERLLSDDAGDRQPPTGEASPRVPRKRRADRDAES
jgi:hypothetical protein